MMGAVIPPFSGRPFMPVMVPVGNIVSPNQAATAMWQLSECNKMLCRMESSYTTPDVSNTLNDYRKRYNDIMRYVVKSASVIQCLYNDVSALNTKV